MINRFDVAAFGAPRTGAFGSAAKGVIKGPGSNIFNAGLTKTIRATERLQIRCELTATNLFNHPNWANPGVNITSLAGVGVISATGGVASLDQSGARNMRAGLRFEF